MLTFERMHFIPNLKSAGQLKAAILLQNWGFRCGGRILTAHDQSEHVSYQGDQHGDSDGDRKLLKIELAFPSLSPIVST